MANVIKIKRSITSSTVPAAASLSLGELYVNVTDKKVWVGDSSGNPVLLADNATLPAARFPALTGDVTTSAGSLTATIGATKVTSAMLNSDVYSTAHSWSGQQTLTNPVVGTQTAGNSSTLAASTAFVAANTVASLNGQVGALAFVPNPQVRVTLTSGVPSPIADVTAATSIYATPVGGNQVPIWDGTRFVPRSFTERTLALCSNATFTQYHISGFNFDLYMIYSAGAVVFGSGPKWVDGPVAGSDNIRGSGSANTAEVQWINGIPTNKNAISIRTGPNSGDLVAVAANQGTIVGSFRATANGQATDSKFQRLVANAFNMSQRQFVEVVDVTGSWTYSTSAYRALNGNTANKADLLFCFDGGSADAVCRNVANSSTATLRNIAVGIGINSSTVLSSQIAQSLTVNNTRTETIYAFYKGNLGQGLQSFYPLEYGGGADTQTFFGGFSHLIGMVTN